MNKRPVIAALVFGVTCLVTLPQSDASDARKTGRSVVFTTDVAPIFYKRCVGCHHTGDIAPMSLLNYKEARPWARSIKEKVVKGEMPPWGADARYGEFSNDVRLTQSEIDTIVAWVDQGAREGNTTELAAAPDFNQQWEIGRPDLILSMTEEYTIGAQGADEYKYFRVPTNFTEDKWIQAAEFRPGNKRVVHHAVVFIETPDLASSANRVAAIHGGGNRHAASAFETTVGSIFVKEGTVKRIRPDFPVVDDLCNTRDQGHSLGSSEMLCVYAPGRNADVWPEGTAKRVPAGSNLIFQMHYSKTTGKVEKDRTSLALRLAKTPVLKMITTRDISNISFKIPAGADNHEVTSCYTFPRDVQVVSYMPHMHVRGKDMKYEVVHADGRRETLLWVPKYNFNWQTLYKLRTPITIEKGAKFVVVAHYDNSQNNKYNPNPTTAVRFGEPTYDEMMVGFVDYIVDAPKPRMIAKLDSAIYDSYVGEYSLGVGTAFKITRERDSLVVEYRGQQVEIYPESETKFFLKAVEGDITFVKNDAGQVTELIFERSGRVLRAKKIAKPSPSAGR